MRRRTFVLGAIAASVIVAPALSQGNAVVSVFYAGSLVTVMEGPIKSSLAKSGIDLQGQSGGSKQLANFITSGKDPDIFISVDPKLVSALGSKVEKATNFASTSLGIGWTDKSKFNALFQNVTLGKDSLISALETQGVRIGRTDPQLDPKGEYTVQAMTMLAGADGAHKILGDDANPAQVFPEETLLARLDAGDIDVGFFYKTEAIAHNLQYFPLPGAASMTEKISYTLAVMRSAPHPEQAKAFSAFILTGEGKAILEKAGLTYLPPTP